MSEPRSPTAAMAEAGHKWHRLLAAALIAQNALARIYDRTDEVRGASALRLLESALAEFQQGVGDVCPDCGGEGKVACNNGTTCEKCYGMGIVIDSERYAPPRCNHCGAKESEPCLRPSGYPCLRTT